MKQSAIIEQIQESGMRREPRSISVMKCEDPFCAETAVARANSWVLFFNYFTFIEKVCG